MYTYISATHPHIQTHASVYRCVCIYMCIYIYVYIYIYIYLFMVLMQLATPILLIYCPLCPVTDLDFICVTWLVYVFDMSHSFVWHDSFISVVWLIHMCDMTHSYLWHLAFIRDPWLIHICDMTHSYVSWLIHVCDMPHWYLWHDSFIHVTCLRAVPTRIPNRNRNRFCTSHTQCETICDICNGHNLSQFRICDPGHTLCIFGSFFSITALVTFWSQMSQIVIHSNVTRTNLFLFLISKEMVRTKWRSAIHTRKSPLFSVWNPDRNGSYSYMWHDSIIFVTCLIHTCGMTHSYVWHDPLIQVMHLDFREDFFNGWKGPWLRHAINMYKSCHTYEWEISHGWMSHVTDMNESCHTHKSHLWHDLIILVMDLDFMCVTWPIHMCDMTYSCMWHDSFMCDMTHSFRWWTWISEKPWKKCSLALGRANSLANPFFDHAALV